MGDLGGSTGAEFLATGSPYGCSNSAQFRIYNEPSLTLESSGNISAVRSIPIGDVNGDGYSDWAGMGGGTSSFVYIYSGATGSIQTNLNSISPNFRHVAPLGDINNDGYDDFAASFFDNTSNPVDTEIVFVLGGSSFNLTLDSYSIYESIPANRGNGISLLGISDIDDDGVRDLVSVTSSLDSVGSDNWVRIYSVGNRGTSNELFATYLNSHNERFREKAIANLGDLNDDGIDEFAVASIWESGLQNSRPERVYVFYSGIQESGCSSGDLFLENQTISGTTEQRFSGAIEMGNSVNPSTGDGPVNVSATGELTSNAVDYIRLAPGFSVSSGGVLRLVVDAGLCE